MWTFESQWNNSSLKEDIGWEFQLLCLHQSNFEFYSIWTLLMSRCILLYRRTWESPIKRGTKRFTHAIIVICTIINTNLNNDRLPCICFKVIDMWKVTSISSIRVERGYFTFAKFSYLKNPILLWDYLYYKLKLHF